MIVLLGIIVYFALEGKRRNPFEIFYYSHHLFVPFFACWQFHGVRLSLATLQSLQSSAREGQIVDCDWTDIARFFDRCFA